MNTSSQETAALSLVVELFHRLNEENLRYCHWKSTPGLPRAMAGRTDLDILVDRDDVQLFRLILGDLDFKPVLSHRRWRFPNLEDYLGFDRCSGCLVHLHVHYRLVLGEQYVKNYCLPLERAFLSRNQTRDGIKVPIPELELIVLALRALLKYRDRDLVRDALSLGRSGGLRPSIMRELQSLLAQTDIDHIHQVLRDEVGFLSPDLIQGFLTTVQNGPRSARALYRLRSQVRRELAPFQRHSPQRASLRYCLLVLSSEGPLPRIIRRFRDIARNLKYPANGGLTVAFLGADGAGKSTVAANIAKWLSWKLVVHTYYMGTSDPSLTTMVLKGLLRASGFYHAGCRRLFGEGSFVTNMAGEARKLAIDLLMIAQGRDRYARYLAGRRLADQGTIVIYDRYPLREALLNDGPMDGPRISPADATRPAILTRALSRLEEATYDKIKPADHYFVLHVPADTAHKRKSDHKRTTVEANTLAIERMVAPGLCQTHIDAEQPLEQVLLQVKASLWHML